MPLMLQAVRTQLLALRAHDLQVRAELAADGSLSEGYHPRMEEVHRANARELRSVIREHGWPNEALVGPDGAEAAWLIAQHSVGEPDFMRQCRALLDEESSLGRVPRWQFAYMDDRVRALEGKPQRFGTQFDFRPEGVKFLELEDPLQVETWRKELGLPSLDDVLVRVQSNPHPDPLPTQEEYAARHAAELLWRRNVGWTK